MTTPTTPKPRRTQRTATKPITKQTDSEDDSEDDFEDDFDEDFEEDFEDYFEDDSEDDFRQRFGPSLDRADRRQYLQDQEFFRRQEAELEWLLAQLRLVRASLRLPHPGFQSNCDLSRQEPPPSDDDVVMDEASDDSDSGDHIS
jgi:hypothetical protein